jgi:hypothetical protein
MKTNPDMQNQLAMIINNLNAFKQDNNMARIDRALEDAKYALDKRHYLFGKEERWEGNYIQFARLLSEINGAVEISQENFKELCENMDLEPQYINELFDRAIKDFEIFKSNLLNKGGTP